jgi:hypothetical protein
MAVCAYSLWYKVFLPITYFLVAASFAVLIIAQMISESNGKFLVIQIALLLLFLRNAYYISTNYRIIPFWDGNWDYGVVKTFIQGSNVFIIEGEHSPASILPWYSGWPMLHTFAMVLSQISGVDAFYISLLLPSLISTTSFLFLYLLLERVRALLGLNDKVTALALLIYTASVEAKFWPMQFVRQNLGILLLFATVYLFYLSTTSVTQKRLYRALALFFAMTLVMAHHYTSFISAGYFFVFYVFLVLGTYLGRAGIREKLFWKHPPFVARTLGIGLVVSAFLIVWWDYFGTIIWPNVASGVLRLLQVFSGVRKLEYTPAPAYYPELLMPMWATSLLMLRDVLIYGGSFLGFFLVWIRTRKSHTKYFILYSTLTFGVLFLIDNFLFRVTPFRLMDLAAPFVVFLSAKFYSQLLCMPTKKMEDVWRPLSIIAILIVLILASFLGFWGHAFAPIHVYDPSINPIEIGERNTDFMRVHSFFSQRIKVDDFQAIWADDDSSLVSLMQPENYDKIWRLEPNYIQKTLVQKELVCAFKDLNLYYYYSREYSPISTIEQAQRVRYELYEYLDNRLLRMYDDGKYKFWFNEPH